METQTAFLSWLKEQNRRDDPVGDLAQDYIIDRRINGAQTFIDLHDRVSSAFNTLAMDALKDAWGEFTTDSYPAADEEAGNDECELHAIEDCEDCEDL